MCSPYCADPVNGGNQKPLPGFLSPPPFD